MKKLTPILLIILIACSALAQKGKPETSIAAEFQSSKIQEKSRKELDNSKHHGVAPQCDESLWQHVYAGTFGTAESRLVVIDRCRTVTGKIVWMNPEDDGDIHFRLRLDPGQTGLLNKKNRAKSPRGQSGNLVIEPICTKTPTQPDTVKERVCINFRQKFPALAIIRANIKKKKPTHVEVTGALVTDMLHKWNEIHPVTALIIK